MNLDGAAWQSAIETAEAIGWPFESLGCRDDLGHIIAAYLAALPIPEERRDRIAVVVGADGEGVAKLLPSGHVIREMEWVELDRKVPGISAVRRNIVSCALQRPVTDRAPAEVIGEVEG